MKKNVYTKMKIKICSKCKKELTVNNFYKDRTRKDGLLYLCKKCTKIRNKIFNNLHKEEAKKWRKNHKEEMKIYKKDYYLKNRIKLLEQKKEYYGKHKQKIISKVIKYSKNRRKTDINYRLTKRLRTRIWFALRGICKSKSTMKLIGCSIEFLREHLEKQFIKGMSWNNYGKWHIDHIIPCASFDLTKPEEQRKCFHYTNLQPLWAEENLSKGAKT